MSKAIMVDNMPIKYQIWDTAGQEKYHSLAPMYYRGVSGLQLAGSLRARAALTPLPLTGAASTPSHLQAAAAIIVYDITKATSFNTLKNWVRELQQLGPENIVIAVCGNKADLESKRVR